jgi:hypothetical protein
MRTSSSSFIYWITCLMIHGFSTSSLTFFMSTWATTTTKKTKIQKIECDDSEREIKWNLGVEFSGELDLLSQLLVAIAEATVLLERSTTKAQHVCNALRSSRPVHMTPRSHFDFFEVDSNEHLTRCSIEKKWYQLVSFVCLFSLFIFFTQYAVLL